MRLIYAQNYIWKTVCKCKKLTGNNSMSDSYCFNRGKCGKCSFVLSMKFLGLVPVNSLNSLNKVID